MYPINGNINSLFHGLIEALEDVRSTKDAISQLEE